MTVGDVALYNGIFGPRFAVQSSDAFAKAIGYERAPIDDLLQPPAHGLSLLPHTKRETHES